MQTEQENTVVSKQVLEMIAVAHEYCVFLEKAENASADQIVSFFQKIAPLLYLKGAMLPTGIFTEPEHIERFVTEEQWEGIFKILREKFAGIDLYFALDENNDSHQFSLADNMADVYQDMKDFVLLFQKAPMASKTAAVAELQRLYETHWGKIMLRALAAIHSIVYRENEGPAPDDDWDF